VNIALAEDTRCTPFGAGKIGPGGRAIPLGVEKIPAVVVHTREAGLARALYPVFFRGTVRRSWRRDIPDYFLRARGDGILQRLWSAGLRLVD